MQTPTPEDVQHVLAPLDARRRKIVAGMLAVMIKDAPRVKEREWVAERLTEITLLSAELELDTPQAGVSAVGDYLREHAEELLRASYLLFQRVGLDLAPRATAGFSFEDALRCGLEYLPADEAGAATPGAADRRDLGEQPLARLMAQRGLKPHDLVAASSEQLTHKMVTRAMKGRRLTANTMGKVQRAWNQAAGSDEAPRELFDYRP